MKRIKVPCNGSSKKENYFFLETSSQWQRQLNAFIFAGKEKSEYFLVSLLSQEYAPKDVHRILGSCMKQVLDTKEDVPV